MLVAGSILLGSERALLLQNKPAAPAGGNIYLLQLWEFAEPVLFLLSAVQVLTVQQPPSFLGSRVWFVLLAHLFVCLDFSGPTWKYVSRRWAPYVTSLPLFLHIQIMTWEAQLRS